MSLAQRPTLSPVSSLSEFSVISHPLSPVFVEPGSDDDEIVFSPSRSASALPSRPWDDDGDDYILIASPRATRRTPSVPPVTPERAPVKPVAVAVAVVAAVARDGSPHTPTMRAAPTPTRTLPTPRSVTTTRLTTTPKPAVSPTVTTVTSAKAAGSIPAKKATRRSRRPKADKAKSSKAKAAANAYPSPSPSPSPATPTPQKVIATTPIKIDQRHIAGPAFALESMGTGIGSRGVVVEDEDEEETLYQAAVNYVSRYLDNPFASIAKRLPLLQAILIELGICSATGPLPQSVRSARALLKAEALINVRDYVAERGRGLDAMHRIMFPSRTKLMKDLRARRVPLQWIKERGLTMFLSRF